MKRVTFVAGTIAAVAVIAIGMSLFRPSVNLEVAEKNAPGASHTTATSVTHPKASDSESRAAGATRPHVRPAGSLAAELAMSKDWRSFALNARAQPQAGGYFYAMLVTNWCGMDSTRMPHLSREAVSAEVAKTGTVTPVRIEMSERLMSRCSSFAENEAAAMHREIRDLSADNRDPLVSARRMLRDALKGSNAQATAEALRMVFAADDPVAPYSEMLLTLVMSKSAQQPGSGALWFDNVLYSYDDPVKRTVLDVALASAPCAQDVPLCDTDIHMSLACLGGQYCTDQREDFLRHQYVQDAGLSEVHFAEALTLGARIRQAVADKRVAAFVR